MRFFILILLIQIPNIFSNKLELDTEKIINLIVEKYEKNSIKIYNKFENNDLIKDLENAKSRIEIEKMESLKSEKDSITMDDIFAFLDEEINIEFKGITFNYSDNFKRLKKYNSKRIRKYGKGKYHKTMKNLPLISISKPIISEDGKFAIVYNVYYCKGLCGSGGIYFLEKTESNWRISEHKTRWIS